MLGELNETQVRNLLTSQVIGNLACTDGKQPYVVPVTYCYDGDYIYGQCNEGMKLSLMRKNPNVCLEVNTMTDMANWQSAIVFGKFEELKSTDAIKARDILKDRIFPLLTSSTIHLHEHGEKGKIKDNGRVKTIMYRIKIRKITGRYEKQ